VTQPDAQPFDPFAVGRRAKHERRIALAEALATEPPEPERVEVEVELDMLADAVAERLLGRLGQEPEEPAGFFDGAVTAKQERQAALVNALTGRATTSAEAAPQRSGGFDGGARTPVPVSKPPEQAHGELLAQLLTASRVYRG
jgi:hypothetical protein